MSHVVVAASQKGVETLFDGLVKNFSFESQKDEDLGALTAGYHIKFHLEDGSMELRDDNSIRIKELDIIWDILEAHVGLDIPEICVGGFCIIPNPFGGCVLRAPRVCIFSADPDIDIPLDLSGLVRSEISVTARPVMNYHVDPNRAAWMDDWDAEDADVPNRWRLFIFPTAVDIDVFDIPDMVGDLLDEALTAAVNALLPGDNVIKDLIMAIIGSVTDLIRTILDLPDDIAEWLSDLLGISLGLFNVIVQVVSDYLASRSPLEIEDPFPVLEAEDSLVAVKVPIRDVSVAVNHQEMVIQASVGGV